MDKLCTVQVDPNLYFVFVTHKKIQHNKKKNDADTMYGNTSLQVTHK